MPRRSILSAAERENLLALPDTEDELIRHYTFSEPDLSMIRQRRGDANRLGVAVQLCLLRFPGQGLLPDVTAPMPLLQWIGRQLQLDPACWPQYAERDETRREHLLELRAYLGMEPFGLPHYRQAVHTATELALQTDKGILLARDVLDSLRRRHIILPTLDVVERICAEAITRANRRIYDALPDRSRTSIVIVLTICSSAATTAKRPGWLGCASLLPNRTRDICWNISNASRHGRRSTCLRASSA